MSENENHIILFDGVCNLCNSVVKFIVKRDRNGKFKFTALQSNSGKVLLNKFGLVGHDIDSFVLISGEQIYLKSTAGLRVFRELGGIWKLMYVFIYLPKSFRDFIYNIIAKTRYRIFGKRSTCMVLGQDIKERFF